MCRRLILLVCFVMAVGMVGSVRAATLFHWTMDGTPDANIVVDIDTVSDANAYAFINESGVGQADGLFYGPSNPWYNTGGTSADFQNDPTTNNAGYGLAVLDTGIDCNVDLSTLSQLTIECFVYPYMTRQNIILRKNNSPGDGGMYYIDTRPAAHSYSGKGVFGIRFVGPGGEPDTGDHESLCHDFPYDPCEWYHVALVWDGNNMKFYVNGQQSQELGSRSDQGYVPGTGVSEVPFTASIGDSCKALGIGCQDRDCMADPNEPSNTGQMFCGRIDEVRISDTALGVAEFLHPGFAKLASNPRPTNRASNICPEGVQLSWTPGTDAADVNGHDVYLGTDYNDVKNAIVAEPCGVYYGRQDSNEYPEDGDPLLNPELNTTYYWRIDEVNDGNIWPGYVWYFTTEDGNAFDPSPSDDLRGAPVDSNLIWSSSCLADTENLYFGTNWADVDSGGGGTSKGAQSSPWDPGPLEPFTWYYWRVDEVGDTTITGDVWSFRTRTGLLLWYKFDNGSLGSHFAYPTPIPDSTGNVEFLKYVDPNWPTPGDPNGYVKYGAGGISNPSGKSAEFEPRAGLYRLDTGPDDILRLDTYQYTIEMWIYINSGDYESEDMAMIRKGQGSWAFVISDLGDDDDLRWYHNDDDLDDGVLTDRVDEWLHVAAVFDQSLPTDNRKLYFNGELVADATEHDTNPPDDTNTVTIGCEIDSDGKYDDFFNGRIDELRILDVALDPTQFLYPRAIEPSPEDGEGDIEPNDVNDPNLTLSWTPWAGATDHDVYFGSSYINVRDGNDPSVDMGRIDTNSYDIVRLDELDYGIFYYWRIDEVNGSDVYPGVVWQFTTEYELLDPNLLLWYPFDQTAGSWVLDNSGHGLHGYDGSVSGGWDSGGHFDGCLKFNDNIGFDLATHILSDIGDEITISVWLDGYRDDGDNWVINAGAGDYFIEVIVPQETTDDVVWRAGNDTNDMLVWDTAPAKGWEGDWHHFAFVKDESEDIMHIYFDGDSARSKSGTKPTLANIADKRFRFGAKIGRSADYVGKMDDLRIYDYAKSHDEILEMFRGGEVELAWNPSPYDGQPDAPPTSDLAWWPGNYASSHEVYFGTNKQEVTDANNDANYWPDVYKGKQELNTYELPSLDLTVTYYWRIDEVNDPNNDRWTGNIWRFKVADYLIIDNFDDDTAQDPPQNDWWKGSVIGTGATLSLRSTPPVIGEHSMRYQYWNFWDWQTGYGYYSETQTISLEPNDWDYYDVKTISLWFYGQSGNAVTAETQMNLGLEDDANYAVVWYDGPGAPEGEEINDIQVEEWQLWEVRTNRFTNINFRDVKKICIGFGYRGCSIPQPLYTGFGVVFFDEINLYVPTCMPDINPLEGDFNADCTADWEDVEIMADDWLETDVNLSPVQQPNDVNLVGWWKLDEEPDSNVTDYAGYDNNGVIETLNTNAFWADAGHDGNAMRFDGGRVLVPDACSLRPKYELTVCAWVKYYSTHDNSARVAVKGKDNKETFSLEVGDEDVCALVVRDGNDYNPGEGKYESYDVNSYQLEHGDWTHLAGTFKQGDCIKIYVNGQLEATNNDANAVTYLSQDTGDLAIGNRSDATNRAFEGLIDEVRVYNRALSAAEIAYIATDETGIFTVQSVANLYNDEVLGDRAVNLRDFAKLANNWLVKKLWPED